MTRVRFSGRRKPAEPSCPGLMFPLRFRDDQHTGLQFALLKNLLDGDDPNVFGAVHVPNEEYVLRAAEAMC